MPSLPTAKQLRYMRGLALRCGETFAYPSTAAQASAEIERLKGRKRTGAAERRNEARRLSWKFAERQGDAAAVRSIELRGYGSNASWR